MAKKEDPEKTKKAFKEVLDRTEEFATKFIDPQNAIQLSCADLLLDRLEKMKKMGIVSDKDEEKFEKMSAEQRELEYESRIQFLLQHMFKDCVIDDDPYGDGDQSELKGFTGPAQVLRNNWASGMDYNRHNLSEWGKACFDGEVEKVRLYIEKAEDKTKLLERRETMLRTSALFHPIISTRSDTTKRKLGQDRMDVLKLLIKHGARVNARDVAGYSVLYHCVTCYGNENTLKMAQVLIDEGADPNLQNRFGGTGLHENTMGMNTTALEFLIKNGADPLLTDNDGITPYQLARLFPNINKIFSQSSKAAAKKQRKEFKAEQSNGCSMCGSTDANKRCKRCLVARYCNRKCQMAHWPEHKKPCRDYAKAKVTVAGDHDVDDVNGVTMNYMSGEVKTFTESSGSEKEKFRVKIQIPLDCRGKEKGALFMYNKGKSVQQMIRGSHPRYDEIVEKIKKQGVKLSNKSHGVKGYFMAQKLDDGSIEIQVENILPPENW